MSRAATLVLLAILYALVSTASIDVFMSKRAFFEGSEHRAYAFETMLDRTAHRPFVHRALMPALVNATDASLPASIAERYGPAARELVQRYSVRADGPFWTPSLERRYLIAFVWMNLFAFAALWALRDLLGAALPGEPLLRDLAPVAFGAAVPLTYMNGGFMYDPADLFFGFVTLALAWRGRHLRALVALALAVLNKETAALGVVFLSIVAWHVSAPRVWARFTAAAGAVAAGVLAFLWWRYASSPGSPMYDHVAENWAFWTQPRSWWLTMTVHAPLMLLPRGLSLVLLLPVVALLAHGWRERPAVLRRLLVAGAAINLPLFFLFCWKDETRNLYLMAPALVLNLCAALAALHSRGTAAATA